MKRLLAGSLAAIQLLCTGCSTATTADRTQDRAAAIATAQYPEMAPYPNEQDFLDASTGEFDNEGFMQQYEAWSQSRQVEQTGDVSGLSDFMQRSTAQFLSGAEGENRVYSPVNVYMALAMLAELTDGESRQQILDLLQSESMDALRAQANAVWNANYCDDGATTSIFANSIWLNQDVPFKQDTLDTLAAQYYASSYRGEMGSDALNTMLRDWLNKQTGGLLEGQASDIQMDAQTILALASTVYFRAKWVDEFAPDRTTPGTFHQTDGDVTCSMMHQSGTDTYYWADHFAAVSHTLYNNGAMWFVLPDAGISPEQLLADEQLMAFFTADGAYERDSDVWENQKQVVVNLTVPQFDISSGMELCDGLKALGVTDVFDEKVSDFSPMTSEPIPIVLSEAQHAARVMIDEEGCTAAAFTAMLMAGAAMPPEEEVDFVLDRPFLFFITGADGLPLFVGTVNQPTA